GQSGGGAKVSTLMAMPEARGLFHKAIVQSGSHLEGLTPDEATRYVLTFLAALDMKANDVPRLSRLPVNALMAALGKVMRAPRPRPNFSPVIDGIVLPRGPWQPDAPQVSADVPMLIGSNATETTALIGAANPADFSLDNAQLPARLVPWLPARDIARVIGGFRALMPDASASDLFFAITSDRRVRQQAWAQAKRKAAQGGAPVWLYELDWRTPVDGGKWGSPHSLDVPFVFDNVARSASMVGTGPAPQLLADQMSAAWIAFARTGKPGTAALPAWPPFTAAQRATMVFDTTPRMIPDYRSQERMLLASLPLYRVRR
ncbi:MAG TPA: carboxylesterase family protein, partial [Rhodopila sp.]|nr:carboxylesterase family protein [Rhodopila sp.]